MEPKRLPFFKDSGYKFNLDYQVDMQWLWIYVGLRQWKVYWSKVDLSSSEFFKLGMAIIWGWAILGCGECPVHCGMFGGIPGLDPSDISNPSLVRISKMYPNIVSCPFCVRTTIIENRGLLGVSFPSPLFESWSSHLKIRKLNWLISMLLSCLSQRNGLHVHDLLKPRLWWFFKLNNDNKVLKIFSEKHHGVIIGEYKQNGPLFSIRGKKFPILEILFVLNALNF